MLHDLGFADLEKLGLRFDFCARSRSSRIANSDRTRVVVRHGPQHVDEFVFIFRLHVHPIWDVSQIPDIEQAVVRRAIVAA
ncbi:MAG: hypothetical protein Udaeo2_25760 [Candidatus Udaeobacter sp.]|nr:MAG: hypothetical protein Udaeo2_25760 [Candidatus Udaeobacter sp.]